MARSTNRRPSESHFRHGLGPEHRAPARRHHATFPIRSLMGFVVVSAVAVAAIRNADDYGASGMILATPMLFGAVLICALCGRERSLYEQGERRQ